MSARHEITHADIMPMEEYARTRKPRRDTIVALKRRRRIEVGPHAVFYFECYETMWHQIHEMLFIEKGGAAQVADELNAFNPLIPKGSELVATIMFEIDDPVRRRTVLARLGGVEETAFIKFGVHRIAGVAEDDVERTSDAGKASAVQFLHFPFTAAQVEAFRATGTEVTLGFDHKAYDHMAVMPDAVRDTLAGDFD